MTAPPAAGSTGATSALQVVDLPARVQLTDDRARVLFDVGPFDGGEHGQVVLLAAMVAVDLPSGFECMVFQWRAVPGPGAPDDRPLRRLGSANLWGPERLFVFVDTEELPAGRTRIYRLTAQAEMPSGGGAITAGRAVAGLLPMAAPSSGPGAPLP